MLRIIAGKYRGRQLEAPEGRTTRPITDRVKQSLFNILGSRFGTLADLPPFEVLDLFAGSGALGLEALSRGVARCIFVERDRRSLLALRANIERLNLGAAAKVASENAWSMRLPQAQGAGFGLVFVDPPYADSEDSQRVIDLLDRIAPRLAPRGVVTFRHGGRSEPPLRQLRELVSLDERMYRKMHVLLLGRAEEWESDEGTVATPENSCESDTDESPVE